MRKMNKKKNMKIYFKWSDESFLYMMHYPSAWKTGRKRETTSSPRSHSKNLQLLSEGIPPGFRFDVCGMNWKYHSALISYRCDISVKENTSNVKHGATMYPCILRLKSKLKFVSLKLDQLKSLTK